MAAFNLLRSSQGSMRPLSEKQLAHRAEKFRLWARPSRHPLGLEPRMQAKTRRLRRMTALAMLAVAHSSAALLHSSTLARCARPDDPAAAVRLDSPGDGSRGHRARQARGREAT